MTLIQFDQTSIYIKNYTIPFFSPKVTPEKRLFLVPLSLFYAYIISMPVFNIYIKLTLVVYMGYLAIDDTIHYITFDLKKKQQEQKEE